MLGIISFKSFVDILSEPELFLLLSNLRVSMTMSSVILAIVGFLNQSRKQSKNTLIGNDASNNLVGQHLPIVEDVQIQPYWI